MASTYKSLIELRKEIGDCRNCKLCQNRSNIVFGCGNFSTSLVVIGEGPGEEEDLSGLPFVGRSGKLLDKALSSAGISREDVYITNIVKCRPPKNRDPEEEEIEECLPYLWAQLDIIKPTCILTLGRPAANTILGQPVRITKERGKVFNSKLSIPVVPTFHPSYILRAFTEEKLNLLVKDIQLAWSIANERFTSTSLSI